MKNAIRGGLLLFLFAMIVGVFNDHRKVEAVTVNASDSQNIIENYYKNGILDENIEKIDLNLEFEPTSAAPAKSKGRAFRATAYCLRGKTASGRYVRRGIVAADPRVLRLGTRIYMTAGRYTGSYLVADTGGKIKGRILDIWVPSCREARSWGRRTVYVKVLSKGKKKRRKRR